jgi:hypothetical protein
MSIELEIGVYNDDKPINFEKRNFNTIDEAIGTIEFIKLGYNYFKNGEILAVRLGEGKQTYLIDFNSKVPILELKKELLKHYNLNENEKIATNKEKEKISINSNFLFKEDEKTKYAKTSSGERLPFKLFKPSDSGVRSNLLWETQNSEQSTDFALVERRFAENNSLKFLGNERIESYSDIAWLFKSLEDEAIEHAFLVYHFKDKDYFVQHISSGVFDAAFVDNKLLIANILEAKPTAITLVHNHPSGNLKASRADAHCIENLKKALKYSDIEVNNGVIINLRSGKFLIFDENLYNEIKPYQENKNPFIEIQPYSFSKQILVENFQPIKVKNSEEVAAFIASQKFGISDKTELLIMNTQMNIVGKFIMPPQSQVEFIIDKVTKFGGSNCIIYGNNITPEQINFYNERLRYSRMSILDGILLKSENGEKIFESFQDLGLLNNDKIVSEIRYQVNENNHNPKSNKEMETNVPAITINVTDGKFNIKEVKNFEKTSEVIEFLDKYKFEFDKNLMLKDNLSNSKIMINNDATKFKVISDFWAKELSYKTDLSKGMSNTQIDEKQAEYYRNYEISAKKLGIPITPFIHSGIGNQKENDFKKILENNFSDNDYNKIQSNYFNALKSNNAEALIKADDFLEAKMQDANAKLFVDLKQHFLESAEQKIQVSQDENPLLSFGRDSQYIDDIMDDIENGNGDLWKKEKYLTTNEIYELIPEERKGDDFHIKVSKEEAEFLVKNDFIDNIMNKEYGDDDDHWVGMTKDDLDEETNRFDDEYQTFEIFLHPATKEQIQTIFNGLKNFENSQELNNALKEEKINSNEFVGEITFYDGVEIVKYTSKEEYLSALENEFESLGMGAFNYKTILREPELLKKVDDIVYGEYGEDNPNSLDFYKDKTMKEAFKEYKELKEEMLNAQGKIMDMNRDKPEFEMYSDLKNDIHKRIEKLLNSTTEIHSISREEFFLLFSNYNKVESKDINNENIEIIGGKIKDIATEVIQNPESLKKYDQNTQNVINLYINQNPNIMENNFDQEKYLKDQLKYLGFGEGEKLHKDLADGINSAEKNFEIKATTDKALPGNEVNFTLKFSKSEQGGVFFNSYDAALKNDKVDFSQNFKVNKEESFTAKEAINLLEGRAVKIEFNNPKTEQKETAFVKLDLAKEKNQYGNYDFQSFHQNYGVDTKEIVEKSNLVFDKPEYKDNVIKSLEKGNVVKVKFELDDKVIEGKAVLNPQYKNLNLYDNDMNRINTNKPIQGLENENGQQKSNVREQSISRGI